MANGEPQRSRRRFLRLTGGGSVIGLAGCINTPSDDGQLSEQSDDGCLDELDESVPAAEQVPSIDGIERKEPDELVTKTEAGYRCGPESRQQCGNCTFYIDDRTGDAVGACTEVEGEIRSVDWCGLWQQREGTGGDF